MTATSPQHLADPDWTKLDGTPADNEHVTITRGTALLALTQMRAANQRVPYRDYTVAERELAAVLGIST